MSTDKFLQEAAKAGLHGTFRVVPVTMGVDRTELPPSPLQGRKTVLIYNCGTSTQDLWLGDISVGTTEATTSGIPLHGGDYLSLDVGRSHIYGMTTVSGLNIKVMEIA